MNTNFSSSTSQERPVVSSTPLSTPPTPSATSYSSPYLPAGAPPWPTTVLRRPEVPGNDAQKLYVTNSKSRGSTSTRSMLITLGVVVLTLLVGIGLTYGVLLLNGQIVPNTGNSSSHPVTIPQPSQATPTGVANSTATTTTASSLPAPTSFSSMSADHQKSIGVVVKYPSDWVEEPSTASNGVSIATFHPQQALGIAVYVGKFATSATGVSTASAWDTEIISEIYGASSGSGNTNLKSVQASNPTPTIAGQPWNEQDATFSDTNSNLMHVSAISIKRGTTFYSFVYQTPDLYYNDIVQKYLPPMFSSFKFLS